MEPSRHPSFLTRHWGKILSVVFLVFVVYLWWPFVHNAVLSALGAAPAEDRINWRTDLEQALDEAGQANRPLLIYFTADWCPPCQVMRRQSWPDRQVGDLVNQRYVPVKIDVDLPQNQPVSARYAVISIPTLLVTDAQGQVLTAAGFQSPRQLRKFLRDAAR